VRCLPEALKAWRKERDLSQKALAGAAGVSPTLIAMIETGERQPSRLNADDIAKALGVPLEAIAFVYPDDLVGVGAA
jgi:transcriptional regulator with XRE-family HTH domain